jgi:hypothetical protein
MNVAQHLHFGQHWSIPRMFDRKTLRVRALRIVAGKTK